MLEEIGITGMQDWNLEMVFYKQNKKKFVDLL